MKDSEIIRAAAHSDPDELADGLLGHFGDLRARDWCEVSSEGERVLSLISGEDETDSIADCVQSAVALRAQRGAYEAVAEMLGLDAEKLERVADYWVEGRFIGRQATDMATLVRLMELAGQEDEKPEFFEILPPMPEDGTFQPSPTKSEEK